MTLACKIIWRNVALLAGLVLLGGAATWGLLQLRQDVQYAADEVNELKRLEDLHGRIVHVSGDLDSAAHAAEMLAPARDRLADAEYDAGAGYGGNRAGGPLDYRQWDAAVRTDVSNDLSAALAPLRSAVADGKPLADPGAVRASLDSAAAKVRQAQRECHDYIAREQETAGAHLRQTLTAVGGLMAVILLASAGLGVAQYRSVMRPLNRLRDGVRRVAEGQFRQSLSTAGDPEFAELAAEFNRMACQLREFYEELEEKVNAKTRELVRSQRLASVGFLAAGVAHEINNPLNIMSGYAELALARLGRGYDADAATDAAESLKIIREEAFRCKEITTKLLSMARGGGESREPVSLRAVAEEVVTMLAGLKPYRGRGIALEFDAADDLVVQGNAGELKQVLINLIVNAIEAVAPTAGEVRVEGCRDGGWAQLRVRDNGRGMTPQVIEKIFEPFFTDKRGIGDPGTGLGLSITHAIVEAHGGRIDVASDGLGKGSTFVVRLPARDVAAAARPPLPDGERVEASPAAAAVTGVAVECRP